VPCAPSQWIHEPHPRLGQAEITGAKPAPFIGVVKSPAAVKSHHIEE